MANELQIDKIEIGIKVNSEEAVKSLKKATEQFKKLKTTIGGSGESKNDVAKQLGKISKAEEREEKANEAAAKAAGKHSNSLTYLLKTIKRFVIYKALNTFLKGTTQGFQNLAQESERANQVLSKYKSIQTDVGNSMASTLVPIMEALLPVAEAVSTVFMHIGNQMQIVNASLNGENYYMKLNKSAEDYLETLKGIAGFDEINKLGGNSGSYYTKESFSKTDVAGAALEITGLTAAIAALTVVLKKNEISLMARALAKIAGIEATSAATGAGAGAAGIGASMGGFLAGCTLALGAVGAGLAKWNEFTEADLNYEYQKASIKRQYRDHLLPSVMYDVMSGKREFDASGTTQIGGSVVSNQELADAIDSQVGAIFGNGKLPTWGQIQSNANNGLFVSTVDSAYAVWDKRTGGQ